MQGHGIECLPGFRLAGPLGVDQMAHLSGSLIGPHEFSGTLHLVVCRRSLRPAGALAHRLRGQLAARTHTALPRAASED